ncbi:hypothetical protein Fmac_024077 [Flemingia macrophylla]|uniref:Glutathione S-transferase n=1 Tax=Flemingia macrophylla TaxID=520843 RepID=A0ABD1LNB3_9FABA
MVETKLYGCWYSPLTLRMKWTLKLKDVSYENIEEDRFNMSAQLFQYNPVYKRTPVLVHDGKPICESTIIVEYIDQIWSHNPLRPTDFYERALARFGVKYADDMVPAIGLLAQSKNGEEQEKAKEKIWEHLEWLRINASMMRRNFLGQSQPASSRNGSFVVSMERNQMGRNGSRSNATSWSKLVADLYPIGSTISLHSLSWVFLQIPLYHT